MGKYEQLAREIVEHVGGTRNISGLTHCVTRLRFQLKDQSKADDEAIKNLNGVVTLIKSGGQYQVVIGNHVPQVYADVREVAGISAGSGDTGAKEKMSIGAKIIDLISGIMMPSLSVLCACGMIKGVNSLLVFLGLYTDASGVYMLMNGIGDSIFYFFPIVLGYSSAVKLGVKPYLGLIIGASMLYPTLQGVDIPLFGFVVNASYASTVLPVILVVAVAAPIQRFFDRVIPDVIKTFVTPMLTLLIAVPLGFVIIGPIATAISNGVSAVMFGLYDFSPTLAGIVMGACWQILVVFGVHMAIVAVGLTNIMTKGVDPVFGLMFGASFAQTAVVFAIWLKTKNKKLKAIALPAWISGIFGVTEPAIYGVTLPRIKYFVISCIGGAATGLYFALSGVKMWDMAGLGVFGIPGFFEPDNVGSSIVKTMIGIVIAAAVGFILTFMIYKDEGEQTAPAKEPKSNRPDAMMKKIIVKSPIEGTVLPLSQISDAAFSTGALGKGAAIMPSAGKVVAPVNGVVTVLFPTLHAIGITSDEGAEILIHIGMNTVSLEGKYFTAKVAQGDKIVVGQELILFDIEAIKAEGYSVETPVIISNTNSYLDVVETNKDMVRTGDELITIVC